MFVNVCQTFEQLLDSKECLFFFLSFYMIQWSKQQLICSIAALIITACIIYNYFNGAILSCPHDHRIQNNDNDIVSAWRHTIFLIYHGALGIVTAKVMHLHMLYYYIDMDRENDTFNPQNYGVEEDKYSCNLQLFYKSKLKLKNFNKMIRYLLQLSFLFFSFYYIDERIEQTDFPIGVYRSFLLFFLGLVIIYITNKDCITIYKFNCKRNNMRNHYNQIYISCFAGALFCFALHLFHWTETCFKTNIAAAFICLCFLIESIYMLLLPFGNKKLFLFS